MDDNAPSTLRNHLFVAGFQYSHNHSSVRSCKMEQQQSTAAGASTIATTTTTTANNRACSRVPARLQSLPAMQAAKNQMRQPQPRRRPTMRASVSRSHRDLSAISSTSTTSSNVSNSTPTPPASRLGHATPVQLPLPPASTPGWYALPPHAEVIQGCQSLTTSFFQLGFLPKLLFFKSLRPNSPQSTSTSKLFLFFSILSVSAPFTPSLVSRYGSGSNATLFFLGHTSTFVPQQMFSSTLESI
ncbi:hypothetical protein B0H63DRAFT_524752 [Podospora didyma]|uniref:Uncharacterized protein n=1 Tax=Podospora didyma TaxID=330526 RepID=A0AAE0KKC3_9PEZI|nr:hypothetical protein B0H63DRAFT_524752 [Podospora didyma]